MGKTGNKPGVMFYFELMPLIEGLKPMQRLAMIEGMILYARDGKVPELKGQMRCIWNFLQEALDRDDQRYRRVVEARRKGGTARAARLREDRLAKGPEVAETEGPEVHEDEVPEHEVDEDMDAPWGDGCLSKLEQDELSSGSQTTNLKLQTSNNKLQTSDYKPQTTDLNPQTSDLNRRNKGGGPGSFSDIHGVVEIREREPAPVFTPPDYETLMWFCIREGLGFKPEEFLDYYNANGWMVGQNPMRDWKAAARRWERKEKVYGSP